MCQISTPLRLPTFFIIKASTPSRFLSSSRRREACTHLVLCYRYRYHYGIQSSSFFAVEAAHALSRSSIINWRPLATDLLSSHLHHLHHYRHRDAHTDRILISTSPWHFIQQTSLSKLAFASCNALLYPRSWVNRKFDYISSMSNSSKMLRRFRLSPMALYLVVVSV